jgi:hypothetical protein
VFYGHIHQEHHFKTGNIGHHAAKGLMFALPVAASQPKRLPIPWDAADAVQRARDFAKSKGERGGRDASITRTAGIA